MATGDIKNNLRKLKVELKKVNFTDEVDIEQMSFGAAVPFLPILHFLFADYSGELTSYFLKKGYEFYGKSDLRFIEVIYKILVQEFGIKPMLTKQQFFTLGYSEVKVIFVAKIVSLCWQRNQEILCKLGKKKKEKKFARKPLQQHIENSIPHLSSDIDQSLYDASYDISQSNFIQKHVHSVIPPVPNPELALTPQKELTKKVSSPQESLEVDEDEVEINISYAEECEEEYTSGSLDCLPKVFVTKHTDQFIAHDVLQTNSSMSRSLKSSKNPLDLTLDQFDDVSTDHFNVLPSNVTVMPEDNKNDPMSGGKSVNCQINGSKDDRVDSAKSISAKCSQCLENSEKIDILTSRLNEMEKKFNDVISVNNELSTKIILLETKIKLQKCNNVDNVEDKVLANPESNVSPNREPGYISANSAIIADQTSDQVGKQSEYSPVKYTDDEVIVQNFKPLRMSDVQKFYDDDKENYMTAVPKTRLPSLLTQGEEVPGRMQNNSYNQELTHNNEDLSMMFSNTSMRETLQNVKQKLAATDHLLKAKAAHLLK